MSIISQLSQGEFVGIVSDNFGEEIDRKIFRGKIQVEKNRLDQIKKPIPKVIENEELDKIIHGNFDRIVEEVDIIIENLLHADDNDDGEEDLSLTDKKDNNDDDNLSFLDEDF